jgi:plastocyanin
VVSQGDSVVRKARFVAAVAMIGALAGCSTNRPHVSGTGPPRAASPSATATAEPAADGVQQVVVTATDDNHFSPDVIVVKPGKVRITVQNPTVLPQDFAVPALGVHSPTIFAGNSLTVVVDAATAGSFPFVCTFEEHNGMVGTLVVS